MLNMDYIVHIDEKLKAFAECKKILLLCRNSDYKQNTQNHYSMSLIV